MLTEIEVWELLDFATAYGDFNESTPNGAISSMSDEPMHDRRRGAIEAYRAVLGLGTNPNARL